MKEITNEQFKEKRAIALRNEPTIITTTLNNIIIEGDSFDKNYIVMVIPGGTTHQLSVSKAFFKQLAKILNLNLSIRGKLNDGIKDNNTIYSELLNVMGKIQASITPIEVTLLFDHNKREIISIKNGAYNRLSNETLFGFAEELVNKYPQLKISNINANEGNSNVSINIMSGDLVSLTDKKLSSDDETFQFGITLGNSGLTTSIGDFAYRLVCSNGMMGIRTDERFFLKNTEQDGLMDLYKYFEQMKSQNFIPEDFAANYANATRIHASYNELKKAHDFAQSRLLIQYPEQENQIRAAFSDIFFPDVRLIQTKFERKDIKESELPEKAFQNIRTKTSMWDLINVMTNLGSNPHPVYKLRDPNSFQKMGGKLLSSDWDFEFERFLLL